MAEKKTPEPDTRKSFQDFLASCPAVDAPPKGLVVAGMVLRTAKEGNFVLRTPDGTEHELPVEAVDDFKVLGGSAGLWLCQLSLSAERLGPEVVAALGPAQSAGGLKSPLEKAPPFDKFPPGDKFPPFDKLPPLDKQPPFDTLKEPPLDKPPPIDKQLPFDTLKEVGGGGDTLKEQPFDTLKEVIEDTFKEVAKDPLGEGGGGTGIADTLVEVPGGGVPGGPVIQPQAAMRAAAPGVAKFPQQDKVPQFDTLKEIGGGDTLKEQPFDTLKEIGGGGDTLKEQPFDTLKELGGGDTLKEGPFDTLKELIEDTFKEVGKDPLGDGGGGTGIADTLVEVPGGGFPGGPVIQPQAAAAMRADAPGLAKFPGQDKHPTFDTLKELGGGDTLKEQPFDTLKELGGGDTLKEQPFDTLKELGGGDTLKEGAFDTLKEVGKDPLGDGGGGTGIADTLVETPFPGGGGPVVQPAFGMQGVAPFVLATPHQAPQGALAQQYLAAQMARGMVGL